MDFTFFLIQALNGVQYGLLLFLIASGLTLIFGIMHVINLAHGAFYMVGAYLVWSLTGVFDSFVVAILAGIVCAAALGWVIERFLVIHLYNRDHLDQVLLTYGLILVLNEVQRMMFGSDVHGVAVPSMVAASIPLTDTLSYPVYRLVLAGVCLALAFAMYWIIQRTRLGMWIRAGAANREMTASLGIDIRRLNALVFAAGTALAAFAGMIAAPLSSVYPGMGDNVIIISFVVVVIGGIGSVKGAFLGALAIGLTDTFGRVLLPEMSSVMVYALMAAVLLWKPNGLFARA
ncbi:MAG: ABC transporter permease [Rhodospirillaceae bacterium BRH_c57]|nr:MAG: ABC transporter permease [Rhodospirillaceae bacterium BRH_c57]